MKSIAAIALIGAASAATEMESSFMAYITQFNKSYTTYEEFEHRFAQFVRNQSNIVSHNASDSTFTLGLNQFSDWTEAEYSAILTYQPMAESEMVYAEIEINDNAVANSVDWRTSGAVQAIKDQGQCGSCWAFSAVSAMESAHKIQSGSLLSFAEQQLVDCSTTSFGCNGGNAGLAFRYYGTHGAMAESSYKYTAKNGTCQYSDNNTGVKASGHTNVLGSNVTQMKNALAQKPLSVAIEADQSVFQSYKSGIFNSTACGTSLDHATNVVGWGSENGTEYWIMRNSWGTTWGDKGYMRLAIVEGNGICGIQMQPLFPTTN